MSGAPAPPAVDAGQRAGSGPQPSRRSARRLRIAVGMSVAIAVALTVWQQGGPTYGARLDPENPGPDGAQALARVLDTEGVDVDVVRSTQELSAAAPGADDTVVVTSTDALGADTTTDLVAEAGEARIVLVEPDHRVLERVGNVRVLTTAGVSAVDAACRGEVPVDLAGLSIAADVATGYAVASGEDSPAPPAVTPGCFRIGDAAVLLRVSDGDAAPAWAYGAGDALTNDQILRADNAAVALRLLGGRDRLVWYVPDPADATERVTLGSLLPRGLLPSLWLLAAAVLAAALWRGRRLGPLSTEPLPVVVRAVETTRSRGRMYRRSGDRAHAAAVLRAAARADLNDRVGRGAGPERLAAVVAHRTGRDPVVVADLLDGAAPATDTDLIRLAHELRRLTEETR